MSDWDPVTVGDPYGEPEPWYRSRGPLAAVIAVGLALIFFLIAFLIWLFSGSGDDSIAPDDASTTTAFTTTTTTVAVTLPPVTPPPTEPPATEPPATEPPVTEPPETTEPPVTEPPETTEATTTTTTTTTSVPVVTTPPSPAATVWDIVSSSPDLSRLRQLLIDAELDDIVDGDEPFTLFAPGNDAFDLLEESPGGAQLLGDPDRVATLLLRHLVFGEIYTAADLVQLDDVLVATGERLEIDGDEATVDGAALTVIDIEGSNGMLHVVERVLVP